MKSWDSLHKLQTVIVSPLFPPPMWPVYEASLYNKIRAMSVCLIPRSPPPQKEVCMHKISSVKSFVHFLVRMWKIILTKNIIEHSLE